MSGVRRKPESVKPNIKPVLFLLAGLALLMGSAVLFGLPQVRRAAQIGAAGRARLQMEQWARAAEAYRVAHGGLPVGDSIAVLEALRNDSASSQSITGTPGREGQFRDPWGTLWQIQDRGRLEVRSAGPNQQFGDEDDLSSLSFGIK
jgi:hypothetical protein